MKERKYQHFALVALLITLIAFCMAVVQYKVPTIMLALMDIYQMDISAGSWLMSIFTLVMVFAAIPSGALAERIGLRKVIAGSSALLICGSIIGAFAPNTTVLLFTRALEGIALTAMTTCGPVLVETSVKPEKLGSALGIWGIWGSAGSVVAALITPTIFALAGMSILWILYALFVLVATVLMLAVVKPVQPLESQDAGAPEQPARTPRYRDIFKRDTIMVLIGYTAFSISVLAVLGMLPSVLQVQGMNQTMSGFASTLPMLISLVSAPVFGALLDKTGKIKFLIVLTMVFLGVGSFVMYTQHGAIMWIGAVLMGAIGMGSAGLLISCLYKTFAYPELKTIGMGVFVTVQGIGQFLGTFLVQALLGPQLDNVMLAGGVVCAVCLVGAVCLGICRYK